MQDYLNKIYNQSSDSMHQLPSDCIHLVITSPPYNVGQEYEEGQTFDEWLTLMKLVIAECKRVMIPGARICINTGNTWRNPYNPLTMYLWRILLDLDFIPRGEIIWYKGAHGKPSTAWGSWKSPSNPVLRDVHEYILIASKNQMKLSVNGNSSITRDEFMRDTKSVWIMPTADKRVANHPAPFPEQLPARLINLYSYINNNVLDPFNGSGTTCYAAARRNRRYVGYDIKSEYCETARSRLTQLYLPSEGEAEQCDP